MPYIYFQSQKHSIIVGTYCIDAKFKQSHNSEMKVWSDLEQKYVRLEFH